MVLKNILKLILRLIHFIFVVLLIVGAFIPKKYLLYFIIMWPLINLHWITNNTKCVCTQIECWLDNEPYCLDHDEDFPFLTHILSYANIEINKKTKLNIIYMGLTFFWLIGVYRYYH